MFARIGWPALLSALAIEAIGGLALLVPTAMRMLEETGEPLGARLSILIAMGLAWLWIVVTLLAGLRNRPSWVRGSAITIHVLLFAAGTGMLQMRLGSTALGWGVVLIAFVGFAAAILAKPTLQPEADAGSGAE